MSETVDARVQYMLDRTRPGLTKLSSTPTCGARTWPRLQRAVVSTGTFLHFTSRRNRKAQALADMPQHGFAIEDESTLDRPDAGMSTKTTRRTSRALTRIRRRITPPATASLGHA
jgi:hypothetical protein